MRNPAQPAGLARSMLAVSAVTDVCASLPVHPEHSFKCLLSVCQCHGRHFIWSSKRNHFCLTLKILETRYELSNWKVLLWDSWPRPLAHPVRTGATATRISHWRMCVCHLPGPWCTHPVVLLALLLASVKACQSPLYSLISKPFSIRFRLILNYINLINKCYRWSIASDP